MAVAQQPKAGPLDFMKGHKIGLGTPAYIKSQIEAWSATQSPWVDALTSTTLGGAQVSCRGPGRPGGFTQVSGCWSGGPCLDSQPCLGGCAARCGECRLGRQASWHWGPQRVRRALAARFGRLSPRMRCLAAHIPPPSKHVQGSLLGLLMGTMSRMSAGAAGAGGHGRGGAACGWLAGRRWFDPA